METLRKQAVVREIIFTDVKALVLDIEKEKVEEKTVSILGKPKSEKAMQKAVEALVNNDKHKVAHILGQETVKKRYTLDLKKYIEVATEIN